MCLKIKKYCSCPAVILLSLVLLLCGLFSLPVRAQTTNNETKIYFFRTAIDASDMILIESGGHYGLIDASFRESSTISSDGKTYDLKGKHLSNDITNGVTNAKYMIDILGIKHLDFIIGSHSHSDHIGGVPEIAGLQHNGTKLVDKNTVYIYKSYREVNEFYNTYEWINPVFHKEALKGIQKAGGKTLDISNRYTVSSTLQRSINYNTIVKNLNSTPGISDARYLQEGRNDWYDDHITFRFGNAKISLYNLFSTPTNYDENVNSICALIEANGKYVVSNADINDENQVAQKVARAISNEINGARVHVLKADHHGRWRWANTKEEADLYRPMHVLRTSPTNTHYNSYTNFIEYCTTKFGTKFYFNPDYQKAAVVVLGKNGVSIKRINSNGVESALAPDPDPMSHAVNKTGWNSWDSDLPEGGYFTSSDHLWRYLNNGKPVIDKWRKIDGSWYCFDKDGFMLTKWGWKDGCYYYFGKNGAMRTGWQKINGYYYYLGKDGAMRTGWQLVKGKYYYLGENGAMRTGWQKINGYYYYLGKNGDMSTGWEKINGYYYYLGSNGAMVTGWKKIKGDWYYFKENGVMATGILLINGKYYYFADSGYLL